MRRDPSGYISNLFPANSLSPRPARTHIFAEIFRISIDISAKRDSQSTRGIWSHATRIKFHHVRMQFLTAECDFAVLGASRAANVNTRTRICVIDAFIPKWFHFANENKLSWGLSSIRIFEAKQSIVNWLSGSRPKHFINFIVLINSIQLTSNVSPKNSQKEFFKSTSQNRRDCKCKQSIIKL